MGSLWMRTLALPAGPPLGHHLPIRQLKTRFRAQGSSERWGHRFVCHVEGCWGCGRGWAFPGRGNSQPRRGLEGEAQESCTFKRQENIVLPSLQPPHSLLGRDRRSTGVTGWPWRLQVAPFWGC